MPISGLSRVETGGERPGVLKEFLLGFAQSTPDYQALGDFLTAKFPDAEDNIKYGDDFENLNVQGRLDRIQALRSAEIKERFKDIDVAAWSDTWPATIGKIVGTFATPTTLIPALTPVKTLKGLAVLGGAMGTSESMVQQLGQHGQIDPAETAISGVLGAALVPATVKALYLGGAAAARVANSIGKAGITRASATVDDFQRALDIARINNRSPVSETVRQQIVAEAERLSGIPFEQAAAAGKAVGRAPILRSPASAREMLSTTPAAAGGVKAMGPFANILKPIADHINDRAPQLWGRLMNMESLMKMRSHELIAATKPFSQSFKSLSATDQKAAALALFNGDFVAAEKLLGTPAMKSINGVLGQLRTRAEEVGIRISKERLIANYFPRIVKDFDGLAAVLDSPRRKGLQAMLQKAEGAKGVPLTDNEIAEIVERFLHGSPFRLSPLPSGLRERAIVKLDESLLPFYESPMESILRHIRTMTHEVEKRRFFAGAGKMHEGTGAMDIRRSAQEVLAGFRNLDPISQREIQKMLEARFLMGEVSPHKWVQNFRNVSYAAYLGNPLSALVQTGDVLLSFPMNGVRSTLGAIFGKRYLKAIDVGLEDLAHELSVSASRAARFMEGSFRYGGFKAIDLMGKTTHLNASLRQLWRRAGTDSGRRLLTREFGQAFADEWPQLLDDLANRRITEGVKTLLMSRLSNIQPIFASSMPAPYLNNPNGRLLYMLHTFTLRFVNTIYRRGIREIGRGNVREGTKALLGLSTALMAGGVSVDLVQQMIKGQELKPETVGLSAMDNFLKVWGGSQYLVQLAAQKQFKSVFAELGMPPLTVAASLGSDMVDLAKEGELPKAGLRSTRHIPVIGQLYYWWFGRGAELENQQRAKAFQG